MKGTEWTKWPDSHNLHELLEYVTNTYTEEETVNGGIMASLKYILPKVMSMAFKILWCTKYILLRASF